MISKYAPKRADKIINPITINEELRYIDGSDDYYITPSAKVYRKYPNGFLERKSYQNKRNGYLYITLVLKDTTIKKTFRLHRLVATAYLPNPDKLPYVGHQDNNKTNDCVSNLYWTTSSENAQKAFDDGLRKNDKGYDDSQSHPVIVYDSSFKEIDRLGSMSECHKKYGVSKSTVARHCKGQIKTKTRNGYYFRYQE